jgi:hypothetical protein
MQNYQRWNNLLLVLLAAALAVICVRTIVAEKNSQEQRQEMTHATDNE